MSISALVLAVSLVCYTPTPQQSEGRAQAPEAFGVAEPPQDSLRTLSIDDLIDRLPRVGEEWVRSRSYPWVLRPVPLEMKERLDSGAELSSDQWRRALLKTGALRVREWWPVEHPLALSMRSPAWIGVSRIRMDPRDESLSPAEVGRLFVSTCGTVNQWSYQTWLYQELGELPVGRQRLEFDITIERGDATTLWDSINDFAGKPRAVKQPPGTIWSGYMAFGLEVVETLDEAIPPTSSPELDAAVRESLSLAFDDWAGGRKVIFVLDPNVENGSLLARLGVSLRVEVLHAGEGQGEFQLVARTYNPLTTTNSAHEARDEPLSFCALNLIPASIENDTPAQRQWVVRVQGTSHKVLTLWEATQRWNGDIVIPIEELIRRERQLASEGRSRWVSSRRRR